MSLSQRGTSQRSLSSKFNREAVTGEDAGSTEFFKAFFEGE